ncbi:hypothetical protein I2W78_09665 [Streptomyces spinoverrucosus]|uniref:hypothetical protein n=1 Tax=Streptomyces spinoverrucosus TaxID=284043 RepID=UPI0018C3D5F8|nr:hypothetical protein [Streptomyces spinoverrucosus]MBG0852101.1 hypothetical protein [Streptomyces spinoverrucosus]
MTNESGRASLGRNIIATLVAVAVLAVGVHVWLNTNLLGRKEVCGGLVTTDSAEAVFSASGRISDRDGLDDRPSDQLAFTCTVELSSFLPGSDTEYLRIMGSRERGDFPFTDNGRWPSPVTMSFFSGGATGAIGSDHAWVLLPDACTTADGPAIIEGYAPEGSDPVNFTRLLTEVANTAAERADCATKQPLTAPDTLVAAPEPRQVKDGVVCDLSGLEFPGPPGDQAKAMESVQDRSSPTWSCEVSGYATYVVTHEPHIIAGIRSSPGFTKQKRVAGLQVSGFDARHVVADCAGTPTYFSMEFGQEYASAVGKPGTPRIRNLFDNFIDVAGKRFGCNAH